LRTLHGENFWQNYSEKREKNEMKSGSQHVSIFNRMFPVPKGKDGSNAKINVKEHKIVPKFSQK